MNIEELKSAWQLYDKKIQSVQAINEEIIERMIKERSVSRIARIKRQHQGFFVLLTVQLFFFIAVLIGNPFDFKYSIQYVPYGFLIVAVIIAFVHLLKMHQQLSGPVSGRSIGTFLKNVLNSYEKNKVYEKWFGLIFLSIGFLMPLSFLPQKLERKALSPALLETALMMGITLVLYIIAFKAGAFKNRHKEKLSEDLAELNELKAMVVELKENENR